MRFNEGRGLPVEAQGARPIQTKIPAMNTPESIPLERRSFLIRSSAALAATSLSGFPTIGRGKSAVEPLKIALVGCGGRGAGAANQALAADPNTKLVAVADLFADKLAAGLGALKAKHGDRVDVPQERQFTGIDGYKQAIALADVVILATPCAFRPAHFEEAVRLGKHAFLEKPVAVDAPGVRRVLAAAAQAKAKNLKVAVGFQRRHKRGFQEMIRRIHEGQLGEVIYTRAFANTPLRTGLVRKPEFGELEYQCRNWYYFCWLSADFIVDNLVHGIDISNWVHGAYPIRAHGMGALSERSPDYGDLFDHFAVEWEYPSGARLFGECDRRPGCWASVTNHVVGSEGRADFFDGREVYSISGKRPWQMKTERGENPYQAEHDDFFEAIRKDLPYDESDYGAKSTMTAIMGRMAAYSGKIIEWDAAFSSNMTLAPEIRSLSDPAPVLPGPGGLYPIPVAGRTVVL
jgi:myo-inositol 2-dehydrogenase/D-chiro-inositol 1-dehydrogenase